MNRPPQKNHLFPLTHKDEAVPVGDTRPLRPARQTATFCYGLSEGEFILPTDIQR
jgi:hypothetical protein